MRFLIDKIEINEGRFLADWELDHRLDKLKEKYKFKTTILRDENQITTEVNTIRISNMKQLKEFIEDFGDITITQDSGYYFDIGCPRIIISDDSSYDYEPDLTDEDRVECVILANNGAGYFDELGMYHSYSYYE